MRLSVTNKGSSYRVFIDGNEVEIHLCDMDLHFTHVEKEEEKLCFSQSNLSSTA
jgi:hypothetical protein